MLYLGFQMIKLSVDLNENIKNKIGKEDITPSRTHSTKHS